MKRIFKAVSGMGVTAARTSRRALAVATVAMAALTTVTAVTPAAQAQGNLFAPVVEVNDQVITRYEVNQRIAMMAALGAARPRKPQSKL